MLPHIHKLRLRNQSDFFETLLRLQTPHMRWFLRKTDGGTSTSAIVVPKSAYGKATQRNTLKRKIYASLLPILKENAGIHLVGIVKNTGGKSLFDPYEDIKHLSHSLHS